MSVLDKFDAASEASAKVELILNKALDAQWRQLTKDLDAAVKQDTGSLALPATTKVVNEMEAIRDQVQSSTVTFAFKQLHWAKYLEVQAEHPPKKGVAIDQWQGFNHETYPPALIKKTCVSVTDADGDVATEIPDEKWDALFASLNYAQVEELLSAAKGVNVEETRVPPSARSLLGSQDSGASLAQPDPGKDRPRSASKGGNRRTSPKSSATKKAESPDS